MRTSTRKVLSQILFLSLLCNAAATHAATFNIGCTDTPEDIIDLDAAIDFANNEADYPGPDTINLSAGCTYQFEQANNYWYGPNALPAVQSAITIEGNGATLLRDMSLPASAAGAFRFFYVSGGIVGELPLGTLTLRNLTLSHGTAKGGDSSQGGGAAGMGGAIFNQGALALEAVTLASNRAAGGNSRNASATVSHGGAGIGQDGPSGANDNGGGAGFGGILSGGPFGGAGAAGGAGGGGGFDSVNGNASSFVGGGLGQLGGAGGHGGLMDSVGGDGGGGGTCGGSAGGNFGAGGQAGGASCGGGGGIGGGGGAGYAGGGGGFGGGGGYGNVGGAGGFGAGGGASPLTWPGPAGFAASAGGAGAAFGGAIFNHAGTLSLVNCTLTGNYALGGVANAATGSQHASGLGAAIFNLNGSVDIAFSTIAQNFVDGSNQADAALGAGDGAIYSLAFGNKIQDGTASVALLTISNSIVYGTSGTHTAGNNDVVNNVVAGNNAANTGNHAMLTFGDANVVGASINFATLDPSGTTPLSDDPMLGPLSGNGAAAAPQTISITSNSPAFNAADGPCPASDARGSVRPQFGLCDIGAYEYAPADDHVFANGFD